VRGKGFKLGEEFFCVCFSFSRGARWSKDRKGLFEAVGFEARWREIGKGTDDADVVVSEGVMGKGNVPALVVEEGRKPTRDDVLHTVAENEGGRRWAAVDEALEDGFAGVSMVEVMSLWREGNNGEGREGKVQGKTGIPFLDGGFVFVRGEDMNGVKFIVNRNKVESFEEKKKGTEAFGGGGDANP